MSDLSCPCGSGSPFGLCCESLHRGAAFAPTAEALMRSRYSAYAVGAVAYLKATWHPSTRPRALSLDPSTRWLGLEILAASGGLFDTEGVVEFRARHDRGVVHERSRFVRENGRWLYLDGKHDPAG